MLLVVALIAGLFALLQRNHAEAVALKSDAERVGTLAQTETNLDLSMLLALAGVKLDDIPETRSDLLAALERSPAVIRVVHPSTGEITGVAISPDGRLMVTGDSDGAVRFEDLRTWTPSGGAVQLPSPVRLDAVRFSPDGRTVAVASGAGSLTEIYLIDVASRTKRLLGSFSGAVPPIPNGSTTVAFSPNSAEIAVGLADWPITTAFTPVSERIAVLQASTGRVLWIRSYHLHPGGRTWPGVALGSIAFPRPWDLHDLGSLPPRYPNPQRSLQVLPGFRLDGRLIRCEYDKGFCRPVVSRRERGKPEIYAIVDLGGGRDDD